MSVISIAGNHESSILLVVENIPPMDFSGTGDFINFGSVELEESWYGVVNMKRN